MLEEAGEATGTVQAVAQAHLEDLVLEVMVLRIYLVPALDLHRAPKTVVAVVVLEEAVMVAAA
jgi:hypothetical protein